MDKGKFDLAINHHALLIDSLSLAWESEGGALDQVDQQAAKNRSSYYTASQAVTPKHRKKENLRSSKMVSSKKEILATLLLLAENRLNAWLR